MKKMNKDIILAKIKENYLILLLDFIVLCFIAGSNISTYQQYHISMWDFILLNLSDHYYVLYCMIISILVIISRDIKDINYAEQVRYKNIFSYNLSKIRYFLVFISLYLLAHILILLVIGALNFNTKASLSPIVVEGYSEIAELYNSYINIFDNIIFSVIIASIYYIFGFTVLYALLTKVNQSRGYKNTIIAAIIIYILTYIGFKTGLKTKIPILFFNNYILLHHGLMVNGLFKFILVIVTGILLIFSTVVRLRPLAKTNKSFKELIINRKDISISFIVLLAIYLLNYIKNIGNIDFSIRDLALLTMFGSSTSENSFISWLSLTIINTSPIFILGISKSRFRNYFNEPLLIRFKNKENFKYNIRKIHFSYIVFYIAIVILINYACFFVGQSSKLNTSFLREMYGMVFDIGILSKYNLGFAINLLFCFGVFYILSSLIGEIFSMVIILLSKFIFFFLASYDLFKFNYGIVNLLEEGGINWVIYIELLAVLLYLALAILKRNRGYKYGNN
ncbi:hypothetical protein JNO63_03745 [Anaerococcus sp. mt242]|uniref:hypothetical protein n=1 Tax=Anaerococcus sp. mt242 TaxID=2661917 RepID=UPI0019340F80|nr:hypothetical protein [Anaerococcus sp. mt242]MBM0046200.1 hypothetical protein [Anaerococcus sp. mt242]